MLPNDQYNFYVSKLSNLLEDVKKTVCPIDAVIIDPSAINEPMPVIVEEVNITPVVEVSGAAPADLTVIKLPPKTPKSGRQKGAGCTQIKKKNLKQSKKKSEPIKLQEPDIIDDIVNAPLIKPIIPEPLKKKIIKEKKGLKVQKKKTIKNSRAQ